MAGSFQLAFHFVLVMGWNLVKELLSFVQVLICRSKESVEL